MDKEKHKVEWSLDFEKMRVRAGQFVSDVMAGSGEAKSASIKEALDGAQSAIIQISFAIGCASVRALEPGSPELFTAELRYVGEYDYQVDGTSERLISLRQKTDLPRHIASAVNKDLDLRWDIALAQDIPLQLQLKGGVGEVDIDLSQLLVNEIKLETGLGKAALTLPERGGPVSANISGGVGKTEVRVPAGMAGELAISGGLGEVEVAVSEGAALRLSAQAGLGSVDLPEQLQELRQGGKTYGVDGSWETADFAAAERPLSIDFNGGIGNFHLGYYERS